MLVLLFLGGIIPPGAKIFLARYARQTYPPHLRIWVGAPGAMSLKMLSTVETSCRIKWTKPQQIEVMELEGRTDL